LNQRWHRKNSVNAQYTTKDATDSTQKICEACVRGGMRHISTDHRKEHQPEVIRPGQKFTIDCYTHKHVSRAGNKYADIIVDLASRRVHVLVAKTRTSEELISNMQGLFVQYPDWFINIDHNVDRSFLADPEEKYHSREFKKFLFDNKYRVESTPPRDKHAGGVAENSVGRIENATNKAMLACYPPAPQTVWDHAMKYAASTINYNLSSKIGTSPYTYETGNNVDISKLHGFFDRCWVLIPAVERDGKVGSPRANKARWLMAHPNKIQFDLHVVLIILPGTYYGKIALTKDVLFDSNLDFTKEVAGEEPYQREWDDPDSYVPTSYRAKVPVQLSGPVVQVPRITPADVPVSTRVLRSRATGSRSLYGDRLRSQVPQRVGLKENSYLQAPSYADDSDEDVRAFTEDAHGTVYWHYLSTVSLQDSSEFPCFMAILAYVETSHQMVFAINALGIPRNFEQARLHPNPKWNLANIKEQTKFENNYTLKYVPYKGQSLNRLNWLYNEKEDTALTAKARLVLDGSRMVEGRDYDPDHTYCQNVAASSIKIALIIASIYMLLKKAADLEGAFLIPEADPDFPMYVATPDGYTRRPGMVMQVVGNLYGGKSAGNIFDTHFSSIIEKRQWLSSQYDRKFFWKWVDGIPLLLITHSDDFLMFLRDDHMFEWDLLIQELKEAGYGIKDTNGEKFVGIDIQNTSDGGYSMNQRGKIEKLLESVGMTGCVEERLPYPTCQQQPESLSKLDNLGNLTTNIGESEKARVKSFPYREVIGVLLFVMLHTVPQIIFILNVLSRYCNDPGPRHVFFLQHLIRYMKGIRFDIIVYPPHLGPYDIDTITPMLQVGFDVDANLGGNLDNGRSQQCYMGFIEGSLERQPNRIFCWCSTTQGSLSTASTESEIKAINHTLKCEAISTRGLLEAMGFKQGPVMIHEDNMAAVYAAKQPNMTKGLKHLDLNEMYFKEKQAEGVIKVVKIHTDDNKADLGTKRVGWPIFAKVVSAIVVCKNKFFKKYFENKE
jgi:hypothetical protein